MHGRGGAWATAIQNAVATAEGGKYVRTTRFVSIGAGTSGTASLPLNAEVILDDFGGTVDAVVLQISGGKPVVLPALTATGVVVAATFDSSGNWTFSGTPSSYPVALVYRVRTTLANFDSTSSDIWGEPGVVGVEPVGNGGTGLSTYTAADMLYATSTNVLGKLAGNTTATKKFLGMTSSVPAWAQPDFTDLTGTASAAQIPLLKPTSGTAATMWALTGSDGQMFWATDYKMLFMWTNDRWWPAALPDPRYGRILMMEEFIGSDRIGFADWSGNNGQVAGALLIPGQVAVSNSTALSVQRMSGQLNAFQLGTGDYWIETVLSLSALSNGTDNSCYSWGFNDGSSYSATGDATDGAYFVLEPGSVNWKTKTASNGSITSTTSSTAPSANTQYRLSIKVEASTRVRFYVNGVEIVTAHTANMPTGAGRQTGINYRVDKILGSGAMTMNVDSADGWVAHNGAKVA